MLRLFQPGADGQPAPGSVSGGHHWALRVGGADGQQHAAPYPALAAPLLCDGVWHVPGPAGRGAPAQPQPAPPPLAPPNPPPPVDVASTANDALSWYVILAFTLPSAVVFLIACFLVWRFALARWRERRAAQDKQKRYMRMALSEWRGRTSDWDAKSPHGFGPTSPAPDVTKHHVPTFLGEPPHSPLAGAYAAGELLVEMDKARRGPPVEMLPR